MYCDEDLVTFETYKTNEEISDADFYDLIKATNYCLSLDDEKQYRGVRPPPYTPSIGGKNILNVDIDICNLI